MTNSKFQSLARSCLEATTWIKPEDSEDKEPEPFMPSPAVLFEAEIGLTAWAVGAMDSNEAVKYVQAFCRKEHVVAEDPRILRWNARSQREWLAQARGAMFSKHETLLLRSVYLRILINRVTDKDAIRGMFTTCGFHEEDIRILEAMQDSSVWSMLASRMATLRRTPDAAKDFTIDPERIREQANEDVVTYKLRQAASRAAYNIRFLAKASNESLESIAADLLLRGIQYYIHARPWKSRAHAANLAKSAMHGGSQQLIAYWTSPDRARIRADGDGFQLTEIGGFGEDHIHESADPTALAAFDYIFEDEARAG